VNKLSITQLKQHIPSYVINIAEELQKNNFEAFLVGGSVRDVLLSKEPNDFDIATNAYPEQIMKIFPRCVPTGEKFGTITVIAEDEKGEKFDVQVTTYRSEADYMGGRWPTKVEFTKTIDEDLARRDFTINAMALNLQKLDEVSADADVTEVLVDPYTGVKDLEAKIIRAVGDPKERFAEDGLRPMRACRLASQLEFEIEPATFAAMRETNHITKMVSVERLRDELLKLLYKSAKPSVGLRLLRDSGILELVIPELLEGQGVVQPEFHADDVFEHSLKAVDIAEDDIKLATLFHDIGKPRTRTQDEYGIHFYGHDQVGADMTQEIMQRLKFPNHEIDRTVRLVRWHMFYYPSADWRKEHAETINFNEAAKAEIQKHLEATKSGRSTGGWTDGAIRRLIINVGGEENIDALMKLRMADVGSNPKASFTPEELNVLAERIAEVRAKDMALKITDLDITGHDLASELNIEPGPQMGEVLKYLLEQVLDEPLLNEKSQLVALARKYLENK